MMQFSDDPQRKLLLADMVRQISTTIKTRAEDTKLAFGLKTTLGEHIRKLNTLYESPWTDNIRQQCLTQLHFAAAAYTCLGSVVCGTKHKLLQCALHHNNQCAHSFNTSITTNLR